MENITDTKFHRGKEGYQKAYADLMITAVYRERITQKDRDYIKAFISEIRAYGKLSDQRSYKLAYQLVVLREYLPEYITVDNISVISGIERIKTESGYTAITQADYIKLAKRFLLWMAESGYASPSLNTEKLRKIKASIEMVTKTADDILSPQEVESLFKSVTNTRDRAFLEILYESAARAGEIATITWGQVTFYQNYASITVSGKTGKIRVCPLYSSHVILRRWKDQFSDPKPNDLIFRPKPDVNEPFTYNGMLYLVQKASGRANITKNVTLHIFRHSRITHLLQAGLNESTIKLLAWGDISTDMLKVYAHLVPGDVENAFSQLYGIKPIEQFKGIDPAITPVQCPECGMLNPNTNNFCSNCGVALSAYATEEKKIAKAVYSEDDIKQMINEAIESKLNI